MRGGGESNRCVSLALRDARKPPLCWSASAAASPASTLAWYVRSRFRTLSSVSSLRWTCGRPQRAQGERAPRIVSRREPRGAHQAVHNLWGGGLEGEVVNLASVGVAVSGRTREHACVY